MAYSLDQFVHSLQSQQAQQVQVFQLPQGNDKMLEINYGIPDSTGQGVSMVWTKTGSMVAYRGDVSFKREGILEHGFGTMLKKKLGDEESMTLTRASAKGRAQLFLADDGKIVNVFRLQGDSITVNGNDILAFESSVTHKIRMLKKMSSIVSGGLLNVHLSGHGFVAILTHGKPVTFTVGQGQPPLFTDPDATVAWSGHLSPDFKTDIQFKTLLGRGSGESFQMKFDAGHGPPGFVLVQPFEEHVSS